MQTLYVSTNGAADPTKASIPVHLAVNGSIEVGHDAGIVLAGDAAELVKAATREELEGLGLPPMRDLFAKVRQHEVPVYVWKACVVARGATDDDLAELGAQWVTPPDVARLVEQADKVLTF